MSASTDRSAVEGAINDWTPAVNDNGGDKILSLTADDLEMIPPEQSPAQGDGARQLLESVFGFDLSLNAPNLELVVSGDWAIRRDKYELSLTPNDGGDAHVMKGQGLHLLRRGPNGSWRFTKDMWDEKA